MAEWEAKTANKYLSGAHDAQPPTWSEQPPQLWRNSAPQTISTSIGADFSQMRVTEGAQGAPLSPMSAHSAPAAGVAQMKKGKKKKQTPEELHEQEQEMYRMQAAGERGQIDQLVANGAAMPNGDEMLGNDNLLEGMFLAGRDSDMEKSLRALKMINAYERNPSAETAAAVTGRFDDNTGGGLGFDDPFSAPREAPEDRKIFVGAGDQRDIQEQISAGSFPKHLFNGVRNFNANAAKMDFLPHLLHPDKKQLPIDRKAQKDFLEKLRAHMQAQQKQ